MKQLLLTLASFALFALSAHAQDTSSGCGLGWQVAPQQSLVSSTTRSLTNATFLNTVAMTFGTSGCAKHSIVQRDKEAQYFAEANYHLLMMEMAQGNGESLANFAAIMGCNARAFASGVQSHYGEIYPSQDVPADAVLENVKFAIFSDFSLSAACMPQA
jgi:hypothetical protein